MYDHYIAVDWAKANMAIARMTREAKKIQTIEVPSSVRELTLYLSQLRGSKIITIEETTTSQWLYTELKPYVDEILVCDPYRNHLLSEGAKNDRIDAEKLVQLLRAGLLKPVFHSGDIFLELRKIVSGYEDLVKAGVRLKNQRSALFAGVGKTVGKDSLEKPVEKFVLEGMESGIAWYESEKMRYEGEFSRVAKQHQMVRNLLSIPGIGEINAMKIAAIVVDASRFKNRGHFLSYCGLVKLEKMSGGRSYGKKSSRCCRALKCVFKTGALAVSREGSKNPLKDYFDYLIREKGYPEHVARHALARRIAVLTFGVLKSGKNLDIERLQKTKK